MLVDKLQKYLKKTEEEEGVEEKITFFCEGMNYVLPYKFCCRLKKQITFFTASSLSGARLNNSSKASSSVSKQH